MPSQQRNAKVFVVDSRELRRAGIVGFLSSWASEASVELVALTPDEAIAEAEGAGELQMIVLGVGGQSIKERETQQRIKVIRALVPTVPIVLMSDREDSAEVIASLTAGVQGFLPSSMGHELALQAIGFIIKGGSYFPPSAIREISASSSAPGTPTGGDSQGSRNNNDRDDDDHKVMGIGHDDDDDDEVRNPAMTNRQREVLHLLKEGQPNKVIARQLGMTEATVKVHVRQIMRKLGATNRTQAALSAVNHIEAVEDDEKEVEAAPEPAHKERPEFGRPSIVPLSTQ